MRKTAFAAVALIGLISGVSPAVAQLRAITYVSGLQRPVAFAQHPGDASIQFVLEQAGRIRIIRNGVLLPIPFLDISDRVVSNREQGLLGIALPNDYSTSGRFFVNYTRSPDGHTIVARFKRSAADPLVANKASLFPLRWSTGLDHIPQPFANHNGGCLEFGPDGMLYIALGDGGSGGDPGNRAQNTSELLGKILRIDVRVPDSDPTGFTIPAGNPSLPGTNGRPARPEIWSIGWRNPWKFTFDQPARGGTGAMLIADVGQGRWEEIDYEPAARGGRNYGWRIVEGGHPFDTSLPAAYGPLTYPIYAYGRSDGASVTGGYVYRGTALPHLRGRYFFADFVTRRVWSLGFDVNANTREANVTDRLDHTAEIMVTTPLGGVSGFGLDAAGELYVLDWTRGIVLRLVSAPRAPTNLRIIKKEE